MLGSVRRCFGFIRVYGWNEKGVALLATMAMSFVMMALGLTYYMKSGLETTLVKKEADARQAFYDAESGLEFMIRDAIKIAVSPGGRGPYTINLNNGTSSGSAEVKIECWDASPKCGSNLWRIVSRSTKDNETRTVVAKVRMLYDFGNVEAAAALYGPETFKGGTIIDGRNHYYEKGPKQGLYNGVDDNGNPNSSYGSGTYGVYTAASGILLTGSAKVGGTDVLSERPVDYAPSNPPHPAAIYVNATDAPSSGDGLMDSDEKLGMTLREKAIQTESFYTTHPDAAGVEGKDKKVVGKHIDPQHPDPITLSGVTYIELTEHSEETNPHKSDYGKRILTAPTFKYPAGDSVTYGSAILVITTADDWRYEPDGTLITVGAILSGFKKTFVGLMIVDAIEKMGGQSRLIGAVCITSEYGKKENEQLSAGKAQILYSSGAITQVMQGVCPTCPPEMVEIMEWAEDNRGLDANLDPIG